LAAKLETVLRKERTYEKYSWILILIPISVLFVFALGGLIYGYTNMAPSNLVSAEVSPSTSSITLLNYFARLNAWSTISLAALIIFVTLTSFRKGKQWAWYVNLWMFASSLVAGELEVMGGGHYRNNDLLSLVFDILILSGLFLPFRKFFPKNQRRM
jgi:hypothetical protein